MRVNQRPTIRLPSPGCDGAAQEKYRARLERLAAAVATKLQKLKCEQASLIAHESAAKAPQSLEHDIHLATRLQDELTAISKAFDGYIAALDSDDAGKRAAHHGHYVNAKAKLEEWEHAWSRLRGGSSEPTEEVHHDGPTQEKFPSDSDDQAQHIVAMQAQIQRVQDERQSELARSQGLLAEIVAMAGSKRAASAELKQQYRESLAALEVSRTRLEDLGQAYAKRISENLQSLHDSALAELYPLAMAHQDIRSASDEETAWAAFKKHAAAIDDLKSRLQSQGADFKSFTFFDKLKNAIFMEFELHVETCKAVAKMEKIRSALPLEVQAPIRLSFMGGLTARESLFKAEERIEDPWQHEALRHVSSEAAAKRLRIQKDAIQFEAIIEKLDFAKAAGRNALSNFVWQLHSDIHGGNWLHFAGGAVAEVFAKIKDAYQALDRARAPDDQVATLFNSMLNAGDVTVPEFKILQMLLRQVNAMALVKEEQTSRAASQPKPVSVARTYPGAPQKASRAPEVESASNEASLFPQTTEVGAEELSSPDWVNPAKPSWTSYTPLGGSEVKYLRETHPALESRASNLWSWRQDCMGGSDVELKEDQCLALIDWIASQSANHLPANDRLFIRYDIVCGAGTEKYEGTWQLKIINLDPDVASIPTGRFVGNQREFKRPTFHFQIDRACVPAVTQALDRRRLAANG